MIIIAEYYLRNLFMNLIKTKNNFVKQRILCFLTNKQNYNN